MHIHVHVYFCISMYLVVCLLPPYATICLYITIYMHFYILSVSHNYRLHVHVHCMYVHYCTTHTCISP